MFEEDLHDIQIKNKGQHDLKFNDNSSQEIYVFLTGHTQHSYLISGITGQGQMNSEENLAHVDDTNASSS